MNVFIIPSTKLLTATDCPDSTHLLRDTINGTLKSLDNMGCSNTKGDHLVIVLAMSQMNEKMRAEWQREIGKTRKIPTLEELDTVI